MKKSLLLIVLALTTSLLSGQFSKNDRPGTVLTAKNSYSPAVSCQLNDLKAEALTKSKTQKTFAWILTGVGVTTIAIAATTQSYVDAFTGIANEKNTASPVVYAVGGTCLAGGIILFVASAKNKRKAAAASVYINMESLPVFQADAINYKTYPVLGLRVSLK